jgi:OCT family organic cation transporter-like MFS transporter 4/5
MEKERTLAGGVVSQNFIELWKTRSMRKYTLVFYFTWFVNAFVYYGISLNIGDLGGDLFMNFFLAGLVEFPSYFFCMYIFKYIGRRPLLAIMMYGAGFSCLAIIPFVMAKNVYHVPIMCFAMLGKFCITSSFGIIYVYSAEVYPTTLRQIGVGSCSVVGRAGSIVAPFIKELTAIASFGASMGIFGTLSVLVGLFCILLPETRDKEIPDTLEEAEHFESSSSNNS